MARADPARGTVRRAAPAGPARGTAWRDAPAGRHRIFVAVTAASHIREAAGGTRELVAADGDRFRWAAPDHLHLTLRFFAQLSAEELARVVEATRETAASAAPFTIAFAGLGAFPSLASPRVLWVGVTAGGRRLIDLAASLDRAMVARRLPREDRPFEPHLTLGRARGPARPPDLRRLRGAFDGVVLGEQPVTEVAVIESVLDQGGPTHTVVAAEPLRGSAA